MLAIALIWASITAALMALYRMFMDATSKGHRGTDFSLFVSVDMLLIILSGGLGAVLAVSTGYVTLCVLAVVVYGLASTKLLSLLPQ